jgi:hypothetical protein
MEATEPPETVLAYYDELLEADSSKAVHSHLQLVTHSFRVHDSFLVRQYGREKYQYCDVWAL